MPLCSLSWHLIVFLDIADHSLYSLHVSTGKDLVNGSPSSLWLVSSAGKGMESFSFATVSPEPGVVFGSSAAP